MKLVLDLPDKAPEAFDSFEKHYNAPRNLMPHEPLHLTLVMPLPDRPWYARLWTWLTQK